MNIEVRLRRACAIVPIVYLCLGCNVSIASSLGLDFSGGAVATPFQGATIGWSFILNERSTLSALGIWDEGADGLFQDHQVAIWSVANSKTPLAEVTVSSTGQSIESTQLTGKWIFQTLDSSISLLPGPYVVGAHFSVGGLEQPDVDRLRLEFRTFTQEVSSNPVLQYVGYRFASNPSESLAFPNEILTSKGGFGPNLLISPSVPEPSTFALALLSSVAIISVSRSRPLRQYSRDRSP